MLLLIIIIAVVAIFVAYKITKKDGSSVEAKIEAPEKIEPIVKEIKEVVEKAAPKAAAPKKATEPVKKTKAKKVK